MVKVLPPLFTFPAETFRDIDLKMEIGFTPK